MTLTAVITTPTDRLTATLDPATITNARQDLYTTAKENGFTGTFDDFLALIAPPITVSTFDFAAYFNQAIK